MEELSATVEAIVTPKPSTEIPEWIKAFMVPDTNSDGEDEEEDDIEQLLLTQARLDAAPEHLKQIPIVDMINLDCESYQTEIYDQNSGVAKSGNNVDIIMDGETESRNPARDLSIDAKPAMQAGGSHFIPSPLICNWDKPGFC